MTKEEAIARIKNHKIAHKMSEPRAIYISEALDMAIELLEQTTWIPVSERFPNNDEDVLVYSCRHGIDIQYHDDTGWHDIHNDALCSETIAWMLLPKPYKP